MTIKIRKRINSIDIFRGITIAVMLLVNNPGSWSHIYPNLRHAKWNGCTIADLVFPFFLFAVGMSIPLSLSKYKNIKNAGEAYPKIYKRTLLLFITGLILNGFPDFSLDSLRILGVLQRISIVYFFASLLYLNFSLKKLFFSSVLLLGIYRLLFIIIPPGLESTSMEPGKNIVNWLDQIVLGNHNWKFTKTWDPEGILSTIPAVVTTLSGIFATELLMKSMKENIKSLYFFIAGVALIFLGLVWSPDFPINKNLWTSSYVLYTSGLAFLIFGSLHILADSDRTPIDIWNPWIHFGSNAILLYVLSSLFAKSLNVISLNAEKGKMSLKTFIFQKGFIPFADPTDASFLYALSVVILFYFIAYLLYRKRWFVKF